MLYEIFLAYVMCIKRTRRGPLASPRKHRAEVGLIRFPLFTLSTLSTFWLNTYTGYTYNNHKTSGNITLLVLFGLRFCFSSTICTRMDAKERTLKKATYSWPWLYTGCGDSSPNRSNVCPWDLLIVMANDRRTGNWCRHSLKGKNVSEGVKVILGIRARFPLFDPVAPSQSMLW